MKFSLRRVIRLLVICLTAGFIGWSCATRTNAVYLGTRSVKGMPCASFRLTGSSFQFGSVTVIREGEENGVYFKHPLTYWASDRFPTAQAEVALPLERLKLVAGGHRVQVVFTATNNPTRLQNEFERIWNWFVPVRTQLYPRKVEIESGWIAL